AEGIDTPEDLIGRIAERRVAVGATIGEKEVPGFERPPHVAARLPHILANYRRLVSAGAALVAGTDAGIAPVKPHDAVRYAVAQLGLFGVGPLDALRTVTSGAAAVCGLAD